MMTYRNLGKSGIRVSRLCLGTGFRAHADEATCEKVIQRAIDHGCNFIDCANFYGLGRSETILGKAIRSRRDDLVITSKVWSRIGEGPNDRGLSAYHIHREIDRSLRRLQTDRIDLYLLHHDDPATPLEETLRAMDQLVRQGKVRYIGCCNHTAARVVEGLWIADKHHYAPYACIQNPYNLLERHTLEAGLAPVAERFGLGIMAYSPLAVGLLTGRFQGGKPLPDGSPWARNPDRFHSYMTDRNLGIIQAVTEIAEEHETTPAQVAIAWLLSREQVVPILGPDTPDQVDDAFGALEIHLSDDELQRLNRVSAPTESPHIH